MAILLSAQPALWAPRQYTSQNGLPQNSVIDLVMDSLGFLWLSTEGGLVRFDGKRFTPVDLPSWAGASWERVRDIVPLMDGSFAVSNPTGDRYRIGADGALERWPAVPGRFNTRAIRGGACSMGLLLRMLDRSDTLAGASMWAGQTVRSHPTDARRWTVATRKGLLHYRDSTLLRIIRFERALNDLFVLEGHWYGMDEQGVLVLVDEATGALRPAQVEGVGPGELQGFMDASLPDQERDGTHVLFRQGDRVALLVAGERPGALHGTLLPLALPEGCTINALLWSPVHRVLFAGTDTKGLFVYRERAMSTRVCTPVHEGQNSAYYALKHLGGDSVLALSRAYRTVFTSKGCLNVQDEGGAPFNYQAIADAGGGRLLMARYDRLIELDPTTWQERELLRPPGGLITALYPQGDTLWLANARGIGVVVDGLYKPLVQVVGTTLFTRVGEEVWAATCAGVLRFGPQGRVDTLAVVSGACVRSIRMIDGVVLIGTYGRGAYMLVDGRLLALPMDRQGFLTHVHAFAKDRTGMLWMSTNRGLFRVSLQGLRRWARDPGHHVHYAYFGSEDGILNPELNGGCGPAHVVLDDGRLAFPSLEGIVVFDPAAVPDPVPGGRVMIGAVSCDGVTLPKGGELRIPHDHEDLRLELSLPYWGSPANLQLEYRLGGEGSRWIPIGMNEHELRFTRLLPGEHVLAIRKLGAPEREGPTQFRFTVLAPFYREPWFLALVGLSAGLLLFIGIRLNEARLRRRNQELEAAVRERTLELEQVNERLRRSVEVKERLVSIISHDIVTPLRFIARVARSIGSVKDGPELEDNLRDIALSSDKLHANARNILSWIKHQEGRIELRAMHVALNPLVEEALDLMRPLAASKGDTLVNDVPLDDVLRTDRDVVLIIVQNLLSNAVNYTRNGEVRVRGTLTDGHYELCVCDTGPGMSPKALAHVRDIRSGRYGRRGTEHGDPEMQGLGYVIIGELTALLNGTVEVGERPGGGTLVSIRLPLQGPSGA